jgi:hypothetical protein
MAQLSKEALPLLSTYPSTNYYGPHVTKADYDRAFNEARLWALESKEHLPTAPARIYHVEELALCKSVLRSRQRRGVDLLGQPALSAQQPTRIAQTLLTYTTANTNAPLHFELR